MQNIFKIVISFITAIAITICSTVIYVSAEDSSVGYVPHSVLTESEYKANISYYNGFDFNGSHYFKPFRTAEDLHSQLPKHNSMSDGHSLEECMKYLNYKLSDLKYMYFVTSVNRDDNPNSYDPTVFVRYNVYFLNKPLVKDSRGNIINSAGTFGIHYYQSGENFYQEFKPGGSIVGGINTLNPKLILVFHNHFSNDYGDLFVDEDGNEILPDTDNYRIQENIEQYSKYDSENYPFASKLAKNTNWFYDAKKVVDLNSEYYKSGKLQIKNPVDFLAISWDGRTNIGSSVDSENSFMLSMGYNVYHLYLYNDYSKSWDKKSIWSSRPLKFIKGYKQGNAVVPPKLYYQKGSYAVVIDYDGYNSVTAIHADGNSLKPLQGDKLVTDNNFYIVNDDLSVGKDPNDSGQGSNVADGDGNLTDTDGKPTKPNTSNDDYEWDIPQAPNGDGGLFEWLKYIGDLITSSIKAIGNFFTNLVQGIGNIASQATGFFNFIGSVFSFLPANLWVLIGIGVVCVILLRFLGR